MYSLILSLLFALPAHALPQADADTNVLLQISLATGETEFRIGETIPVKLAFSSAIKNRYQINMAQYDRSGRMNYERFDLSSSEGAIDPLSGHLGGMGGLTGFQFLTPEAWTITLNLNEWLRFTEPGDYHLTITSSRVSVKDSVS